jgi:hypothetical protein
MKEGPDDTDCLDGEKLFGPPFIKSVTPVPSLPIFMHAS